MTNTPARLPRIIWPLLVAGLICAFYITTAPGPIQKDAAEYDQIAVSILQHGTFSLDGQPTMLREPGYPLFRAMVYAVFGYSPNAVLWIQLILILATIYLVSRSVGIVAPRFRLPVAWLTAIFPGFLVYSSLPFTEALSAFLLSVIGLFTVHFFWKERRSIGYSLLFGLVLGVAALTRTEYLFLLAVIILALIVQTMSERKRLTKNLLFAALFLLLGFSVVVGPWVMRNQVRFHQPSITFRSGINLTARAVKAEQGFDRLAASYASVLIGQATLMRFAPQARPVFLEHWKDVWARRDAVMAEGNNFREADRLLQEEAVRRIFASPKTFVMYALWTPIDLMRYVGLPSPASPVFQVERMFIVQAEQGSLGWPLLLTVLFAHLLQLIWWGLILLGLFRLIRQRQFTHPALLFVGYGLLIHAPLDNITRYSAPLMPWLIFLCLEGLFRSKTTEIKREHVSSELVEAANKAFHLSEAEIYDQGHPEITWCEKSRWVDFADTYLKNHSDSIRLLDIGAGTGFVGKVLSQYLKEGDEYVASDLSEAMLEEAKKNLQAVPFRVTAHASPAERQPHDNGVFDIVTINSALHHFPHPEEVVTEAYRVLKPGGVLAVMHEPNVRFFRHGFFRFLAKGASIFAARFEKDKSGLRKPDYTPVYEKTNAELLRLGLIDAPLPPGEIQALVDVHSPTTRGRFEVKGFDPLSWSQLVFGGLSVESFTTYNYLGKVDPTLALWRRTLEYIFSHLTPSRGALFVFVARKIKPHSMKIFMSSDTYYPDIGGAEVHVFQMRRYLQRLGHQVKLFVTNPQPAKEDADYPCIRETWGLKRVPALFADILSVSKDCDVFHSHYSFRLAVLVGCAARLRGKPFFITLHGKGILDHPDTPFIYRQAEKTYRRLSLMLATHVISTSEDLAQVCERYYPASDITVIPNGVDVELFDPDHVTPKQDSRFDGADPVLLTLRRLVPKNGIHYAVSAMPFVLKAYPKAKLVMVGDGRMREELIERAERLGVSHACVFLGAIPHTDVASFAMAADVVLFPSTAESTSLACAEMMLLRKKIVASKVGGLIELLGRQEERGALVELVPWESCNYDAPETLPEDRYEEFARKIIDAVENPQAEERAERARQYAIKNLDWRVITEKTARLFTSFSREKDS